jgi:hypothetical protein
VAWLALSPFSFAARHARPSPYGLGTKTDANRRLAVIAQKTVLGAGSACVPRTQQSRPCVTVDVLVVLLVLR